MYIIVVHSKITETNSVSLPEYADNAPVYPTYEEALREIENEINSGFNTKDYVLSIVSCTPVYIHEVD